MHRMIYYTGTLFVFITLMVASCDHSSIVQDNAPPPNSQVKPLLSARQQAADTTGLISGQYIVVFKSRWKGLVKSTQALQFVNDRIDELGIAKEAVKHRYQYALRGFDAILTDEQLQALKKDPRVKYIEQDRRFKAFSAGGASTRSGLSATAIAATSSGQTTPWGVSRVNGPLDGTGKKAWIIDSGIDLNHPDLNVDVANSASFVANESADDNFGHGTYVAGILAAKDNNQGVVGVAAGATVVAVRVFDQTGHGTIGDVTDGIDYVDSKASSGDIINMSLGLYDPQHLVTSVDNAVIAGANAGLRFVIAAGNDEDDASNYSPARIEHTNVWTVSAFRQGDAFSAVFDYSHCGVSSFGSNYGNPPIAYSEPGERVRSLLRGGGSGLGFTNNICSASGTSYAAPHLAGLLLAHPNHLYTDGTVSSDPDSNPDSIGVYLPFAPPPPPVVTVSVSGPQTIHKGSQTTYTATASGGTSPYYYFWNFVYLDCAPGASDCSEEGVQQFGGVGQTYVAPYSANYDRIKIIGYANDNSTPSQQGSGYKVADISDIAYIVQP